MSIVGDFVKHKDVVNYITDPSKIPSIAPPNDGCVFTNCNRPATVYETSSGWWLCETHMKSQKRMHARMDAERKPMDNPDEAWKIVTDIWNHLASQHPAGTMAFLYARLKDGRRCNPKFYNAVQSLINSEKYNEAIRLHGAPVHISDRDGIAFKTSTGNKFYTLWSLHPDQVKT